MSNLEPEWTTIVEEIGPDLYKYFLGSFSTQVASDLVQETLIRLVQKFRAGDFDPAKGALKSYAFGIARYVRLEVLKKKPDFELVDSDSELDVQTTNQPNLAHQSNQTDQIGQLRWAIGQLKSIEQELILQMIDEESTFENIAQKFNMPIGTVKSHIHRAKENLRQILGATK